MDKLKFSVIIPVFNEEESIQITIEKCKLELDGIGFPYEIIVIDDSSSDSSRKIISQNLFVKLLVNPYNLGYGASIKKGIKAAIGEWIIIMDADGTYPIDRLSELIDKTQEYDMVVANRQHQSDHFGRMPAKWFLKKIASFLTGHKIPDLNSGFRVFRRDCSLEFMGLYPSGFSFTTTITLAFLTHDYTVAYVDLPYYKRIGKSSIKPKHFFQFLNLIIRMFMHFRPMRMFMPVSILFIAMGIFRMTRDIIAVGHIGNLAIIFIMASFLTFVLAMIAESIVRLR